MDKSKLEPTEKQIDYCMIILERIGSCPCDEDGTPCFEKSMKDADDFIKRHKREKWSVHSETSAADWGGIPNH
jgi:hypothetical protein